MEEFNWDNFYLFMYSFIYLFFLQILQNTI